MKIVYGVSWIEVEFGQRPEGYSLFLDKEKCIADTKKASENGPYPGGYCGPVRPLHYVEIPFDSLEEKVQIVLNAKRECCTDNFWQPKFYSGAVPIK